jgi:SAM-dependent methyltransferase
MDTDGARWDERYSGAEPAVPRRPEAFSLTGAPADPRRPGGRALDVACGTGGTSLWLAAGGMRVVALDVSARAIELLRIASRRSGLQHLVDARVVDLDDGLPDDGPFDLIVCQRFRDVALYPLLAAVLAPGGVAAITVLSAVGRDPGDAPPGPFHAVPGELLDAFAPTGLDVRAHAEADGIASIVLHRPPTHR